MLLKEVKNKILEIAYGSNNTHIGSDTLSKLIPEAKEEQLRVAVESLYKTGLIKKPMLFISGSFALNGLTGEGMEYVEDNMKTISDNSSDTPLDRDKNSNNDEKESDKSDAIGIDNDKTNTGEVSPNSPNDASLHRDERYKPYVDNSAYKDSDVEPCFDVDGLAKCYAELIGSVCNSNTDNTSMLGIFAPWGRGKTFFFKRVQKLLEIEKDTEYKVVWFNAWKYQDTPALWAYLFETLFNELYDNSVRRFFYTVGHNIIRYLIILIITLIPCLITIVKECGIPLNVSTGVIGIVVTVITIILDKRESVESLLKRFSKISFKAELGVQSEIEHELECMLCKYIKDKRIKDKKVVLYVDDLDRCENNKMISVIESLRTVLENEIIRKRMVVVCSVDADILIKALQLKYQPLVLSEGSKNNTERYLENMSKDQLDKLFTASMALPIMNDDNMHEFLEKLSGQTFDYQYIANEVSSISDIPTIDNKDSNQRVLEEMTIKRLNEMIYDCLTVRLLKLRPRQIRLVYYRCLLAMKILNLKGESMTKELVEELIVRSYDKGFDEKPHDLVEHNEVIDMVVPY